MKKAFILLALATALAFSSSLSAVEEDVAPRGFDQKREGVRYFDLQPFSYFSKTAEQDRPVNVFVPSNYNSSKRYPVLYLLHGIGGNEFEWFGGAPNETISNLIADGSAPEMLVVVPNVRVRRKDAKEPPMMSVEHFREFDAFLDDFQTSLKPEIEKRYSVAPGRENRAIAGLSMGGREALHLGIKLCDQFGYIGAFEPAPGLLPYPAEESLFNESTLTLPDEYKKTTYVFVTKGDRDGVVSEWPKRYAETLEKNGVDPHFVELRGGHDFKVWKESLYRFVKAIFPGAKGSSKNESETQNATDEGRVLFEATSDALLKGKIGTQGTAELTENGAARCESTEEGIPWRFGLRFVLDKPIERGEVLKLKFTARTLSARTESGLCKVRAFFELNADPYDKSLYREAEIGLEAKAFEFPFVCARNQGANESAFGVFMGELVQSLEISDVSLISLGKGAKLEALDESTVRYEGDEPDAEWRKLAEERIEKIRKADLSIKVVDQNGSATPFATVNVRQIKSEFRWGTCVVAGRICDESADGQKYREFVEKYCDVVVFENDMKWFGFQNSGTRARVEQAMKWLEDRDIAIRGHNLVWPSWRNSDRRWRELADDPEALREVVRKHVVEEASAYKGRVFEWDVVNEIIDNRDIWELLGKEEIAEWFKAAREGDPDARLFLNDYGILSSQGLDRRKQDVYYNSLSELLEEGAPLGGIGMQGHFGGRPTPPARVLEILERFSKLGLPIAITEHDIDSNDSALQAKYERDFLLAAFSCESVEEFLLWGFWERSHWRRNAALFSVDWTPTPVGRVWLELVGEKWRSNFETSTDFTGEAKARVFRGEYEITAQNGAQKKTERVVVGKDGAIAEIQLD